MSEEQSTAAEHIDVNEMLCCQYNKEMAVIYVMCWVYKAPGFWFATVYCRNFFVDFKIYSSQY